jgi:hypothetical protein
MLSTLPRGKTTTTTIFIWKLCLIVWLCQLGFRLTVNMMPLLSWFTQYTTRFRTTLSHGNHEHQRRRLFHQSNADPKRANSVFRPRRSDRLFHRLDSHWRADDENSNAFGLKLHDILNRTKTDLILDNLFYRYIVAVPVVAWFVVLWGKL